jgi:hypothetical protein
LGEVVELEEVLEEVLVGALVVVVGDFDEKTEQV